MRRAWQAEKNTDPEVAEMVLYHGTTDKFDAFDPQKFGGQSSISESGGKGVWLTSSPKVADFYGDMSAVTKSNRQFPNWDDRSQAMAARQEISKGKQVMPLTVRGRLKEIDMAGAKYSQDMSLSKLADDARAEGFDGVRFRNFVDGPEVADHVLIFDPSNIRSVNAAFDPDKAASPILTAGLGGNTPTTPQQAARAELPGSPEYEAAKAKGLDMSQAGRMARAREMGFDTDTVLYHGTNADISEVTPLRGNASSVFGSGFYLSRSPASASRWAASKGGEGQNVLPLVIKPEGILRSAPMTEADAAKISAY
jgi:hypothetical protein